MKNNFMHLLQYNCWFLPLHNTSEELFWFFCFRNVQRQRTYVMPSINYLEDFYATCDVSALSTNVAAVLICKKKPAQK